MKKRIISLALAIITLLGILVIPASAANYTTNYSAYDQPESNDYAYWNGRRVVRGSGTTTSEVKYMQASMNALIKQRGLNAPYADVDGSFGPGSTKTCRAIQKALGLQQDGSCGPATIAALKSALSPGGSTSSSGKYNLCWPIPSSTSRYRNITSSLGNRTAPLPGASVRHKGIDIGVPSGSRVLSTADGVVKFTGYTSTRGYYVVVYHQSMGLTSVYQHLSSISVSSGQYVSMGTQLGKSGNTGNSTGPHLHFELVLTGSAPRSVDCAWVSGVKLLDGHYNNSLINYQYR